MSAPPISLLDYKPLAEGKLLKMVYDYYRSGSDDEITLNENENCFRRIKIKPRVLVDVSKINLKTTVLGKYTIDFPLMIAPTAMHKMAHHEGEIGTCRAAGSRKIIMTLSTLSTTRMEEVAQNATHILFYQLYVLKDRALTRKLVESAEKNGFKALVVTVDAPSLGNREADHRNCFHLPNGLALEILKENLDKGNISSLNQYFSSMIDDSLTWKDIKWLKSISNLPIIVKGIHCVEDALLAIECGCAGLSVSNHGGRQLDTAISPIEVLEEIVEACRKRSPSFEVYVDGGIRRGTDVMKALALGAKAVMIGRPVLWGLAVDGQKGVEHILDILKSELHLAMQLTGFPSINSIDKKVLTYSRFLDSKL